jgi:hypothetical protein
MNVFNRARAPQTLVRTKTRKAHSLIRSDKGEDVGGSSPAPGVEINCGNPIAFKLEGEKRHAPAMQNGDLRGALARMAGPRAQFIRSILSDIFVWLDIESCVNPNVWLRCWASAFGERGIQAQDSRQDPPLSFRRKRLVVFPCPHHPF